MDADLPTPDRVDHDPHEVDDETLPSEDPAGTATAEAVGEDAEAPVEAPAMEASAPQPGDERLDLDAISADLEGVEAALARLGDGTYWTDEVTGEPLPDELLAAHPTARRA